MIPADLPKRLVAATSEAEVILILDEYSATLAGMIAAAEVEARSLHGQAAPGGPARKYHVPGPYEIALAVGAALVASGKYDTPGAAMAAGWGAVPEFFAGRDFYVTELAPALFGTKGQVGGTDASDAH